MFIPEKESMVTYLGKIDIHYEQNRNDQKVGQVGKGFPTII